MASLILALLLTGAPPVTSPLNIELQLQPTLLKPGQAPTLNVTAINASASPVQFEYFEEPVCFAHMYLSLSLTTPSGAQRPRPCVVKTWPGETRTLTPGTRVSLKFPLAALFPAVKWTEGEYLLEAAWDTARLTDATGPRFKLAAGMTTGGHDAFRVARSLARLHAVRGVELEVVEGLQLELVAHGHKRTREGDASPLIVAARLGPRGALQECNVNIDLQRPEPSFTLCGHQFVLLKHSYGEWMDLEYFGRAPPE